MSDIPEQLNPARPPRTRYLVSAGLVIALLLAFGLLLRALGLGPFGPVQLHGTILQSPQPVTDFTLTGRHGESISLSDFQGQVVLLYFGYTFCPDVCPTTLATLARALELVGPDRQAVQVMMVTVDPERDTPAQLADYVAHFDESFIGLTGTADEIANAATLMGIFYEKREGTVQSGYLVDHTATVLVVDQAGYLRLLYSMDTPAEDIAADLRYLTR